MEKKTDFKTLSGQAKVQYIWDYYRWHIIGAAIAVSFVGSLIYHYVSYREPLLNVIMINCNDPYDTSYEGFAEFLEEYGYDADKDLVSLTPSLRFTDSEYSTSYNDYQVLTTYIAAGGQDLFFGIGDVYLEYADGGALLDLSAVLPSETLEQYKDQLIYSTDGGESEPYPCAIELTDNEWITRYNYYDTCYFGIFARNQNQKACLQFADFLLNY